MKRRFTILTAALALLVSLAIPMGMWGQTTYTLTINSDDFNSESYAANNGEHTKVAVDVSNSSNTMPIIWYSNQIMLQQGNMQWQKSKGYLYNITDLGTINSVTVNKTDGTFTTYYGTEAHPTSGTTVGNGFFTTAVGSATGKTTSVVINFTIGGGGSTAISTNTTINSTGITNTDVNTSNVAGSLSAIVSANGEPIEGATVTWEGDNDNVATINASTGAVTLVGMGTVVFTASYEGEEGVYQPSSDTYEMSVVDSRYEVSTLEFTAACGGSGTADDGAEWTVTSDGTESAFDSNRGIHYGTGSAPVKYIQLSTSDITGTISKVIVNASTASGVSATVSVTIGGSTFGGDPQSLSSNATDYTFTGSAQGEIIVTVTKPASANGALYVKSVRVFYIPSTDPYITADDVDLAFDATEGSISYELHNATGNITANTTADWITSLTPNASTSTVAIVCDANNSNEPREATVVLAYGEATKDVTVTQAANPNAPLTTMDQIFAKATEVGGTATEVTITFNNWIVSGASGRRAYVTDGTKGFPIYDSNDGLNFEAGQILTGTKTCSLQLKSGAAQVSGLNVGDFSDITTGEVTVNSMTIAALNPINTGAVVDLGQLTYNGSKFVDDNNNQIEPYKGLFDYGELESGTKYMVKGVFAYYNVKEILPRSAADIVEVVTPVTSDKYVKVTSTTDLTSGQYLIVYEEGAVAFDGSLTTLDAASNTIGVVISNNEIAVNTTTTASEFTIDVTAGTIKSASGYYIGQTSDANGLASSTTNVYTNTISIGSDGNAVVVASGGAYLRYNATSGQKRFRYFKSSTYSDQKAIQLYKKVVAEETYTLTIPAFYDTQNGGYRLISSPVATATNPTNPGDVTNMITDDDDNNNRTYDLYRFDQNPEDGSGKEWRNYRATNDGFDLEFGKGYLYGNLSDVELVFTGTAYNGDAIVTLTKTDNTSADFPGWNLVGNPFGVNAYIGNRDFYVMEAGSEIILADRVQDGAEYIKPMEGVFVIAANNGEELQFTTTPNGKSSRLGLNLSNGRKVIDRASVRFDDAQQLPKFQLNRNSTKVYIPQDGKDFAVVCAEEMGAMPVNFKAEDNGTYSLNFSCENVEFSYLHLIDNMTGNDVDLLQTPSYSFEAKTTDYESRFKLVFATGDNSNDDTFAFYSNGSFVINNPSTGSGPAELQVIDITGRIVKSESVNGCTNVNVNAAPGVYMLRLINGDNVKTQKVVVK